jgi:hypothetical protein
MHIYLLHLTRLHVSILSDHLQGDTVPECLEINMCLSTVNQYLIVRSEGRVLFKLNFKNVKMLKWSNSTHNDTPLLVILTF